MPVHDPNKISKVVVHPLVLLSVVDHFNRMGKVGNVKRVVGVLLGANRRGVLDVSNSFAVPFDEDEKDRSVWFLDHDYMEQMYAMFKKVNAREKVVGWYHTGPKLQQNDVRINELIRRYSTNAVLVIIDAKPKDLGLPTEAYLAIEEVHDDGTPTTKTFEHIPSEIGAEEAEEVGVEHLLRDIKDTSVGTLSQRVSNQLSGLRGLRTQLGSIATYLSRVSSGDRPPDHQILYMLQNVFNLLATSGLSVSGGMTLNGATRSAAHDHLLAVYTAALARAVVALHDLVSNKLANHDAERADMAAGRRAGKDTGKGDAATATTTGSKTKTEGKGDGKKS